MPAQLELAKELRDVLVQKYGQEGKWLPFASTLIQEFPDLKDAQAIFEAYQDRIASTPPPPAPGQEDPKFVNYMEETGDAR